MSVKLQNEHPAGNPSCDFLAADNPSRAGRAGCFGLGFLARNDRSSQGFFQCPSHAQPALNCVIVQIKVLADGLERALEALILNLTRIVAGVVLLFPSLPLAVRRLVISIWFNPPKSQSLRALTHISQEICKQEPRGADGNPPAPVILPVFIFRFGAPFDHVAPTDKRAGRFSPSRMTMFNSGFWWLWQGFFGRHSVAYSMLCF